ncbi:MAG: metal ABC transporter permease [Flavobacteriales bacterium]|nr:metal ABC transporter permease [Flavobacteriales bacterium]
MNELWIIGTAALVATSSSLLGCFLVLRRMVMFGDAISHAVLPGIVIAYFLTHNKTGFPVLAGAALTGLLATLFIQFFNRKVRLQIDASIGISYTFLFALGVILISLLGPNVDLDQECVLYGEIAYVPLELIEIIPGLSLPRQFWILLLNMLMVTAFVRISYRYLKLGSFDPAFAAGVGIPVALWQFALLGGVSLTTVVSFESVGAILVIAFLAGPPATAYLLSRALKQMLYLSVAFGITATILGYYLATLLNASIAGSIATVIGVQFLFAFLYVRLKRNSLLNTPEVHEIK